MNKKILALIAFFLLVSIAAEASGKWELAYQPRQRTVKTIATYKNTIFIGTGNGVLKSDDEGKTWEDFSTKDLQKDINGNAQINWITINENKIYIATSFGAYVSSVKKVKWEKIFENTKTESNEVNSITIDNEKIYLCTNDGFWINENDDFKRLNTGLEPNIETGNYEVLYSIKTNENLYLGTSNGIYKFNPQTNTWEDISNGIERFPNKTINAKHIITDNENNLIVSCSTGIYRFTNNNWDKVSEDLKQNNDGYNEAFYLLKSNNEIYTGTASGVYLLKEDSLESISYGIRTKENNKNVYSLGISNNKIYAATDEGLFVYSLSTNNTPLPTIHHPLLLKGEVEKTFTNLEELEPTAIEVQKQAMRFSSLPTNKDFKRYQLQARLRNIVPRVGFDVNSTNSNQSYSQFQNGISSDISLNNKYSADDLKRLQKDGSRYKQLSILWNTNEFIYDDEIKDIISQARLTANIKENILDDVTRIYYKRKNLQLENIIAPEIATEKKLKKELEIAELTSQLDSRTGGWFSKEIEKRKRKIND